MQGLFYSEMLSAIKRGDRLLAILIDPEKFNIATVVQFKQNPERNHTPFCRWEHRCK